jgi:hypothetical protein
LREEPLKYGRACDRSFALGGSFSDRTKYFEKARKRQMSLSLIGQAGTCLREIGVGFQKIAVVVAG